MSPYRNLDLENARAEMRELAADLEALRPFVDTSVQNARGAWAVAVVAFNAACERYTTAITSAEVET